MNMTFAEAAARQHLYGSLYTVWMHKADGSRVYLDYTGRKTGTGLLHVVGARDVQETLKAAGIDSGVAIVKKTKDALHLSNGWTIKFGGTIREEAALAA